MPAKGWPIAPKREPGLPWYRPIYAKSPRPERPYTPVRQGADPTSQTTNFTQQPLTQSAVSNLGLLVGINKYSDPAWPVSPNAWRFSIPNLNGCENDVDAMDSVLVNIYGWSPTSVTELKGQQATRQNILDGLGKLASQAKTGDTVFFFYSGHGSTVKNSATRKILDQETPPVGISNTIVPQDTLAGSPDITDKELAAAFNKILDKGAKLTAVFDSCYSGTIARGGISPMTLKMANSPNLELPLRDIKQPDPAQFPADRGALIVSASDYYQAAAELDPPTIDIARGAFAHALTETLLQDGGCDSFRDIFAQARARLQSQIPSQEPVYQFSGHAEQLSAGLLGEPIAGSKGIRLFVVAHPAGTSEEVKLQGGTELGIHKGALLTATVDGKTAEALVSSEDIGHCSASFKSGDSSAYAKAGNFSATSWVSPTYPGLKVFIPRSGLNVAELAQGFGQISNSVGAARMVADPTLEPPSAQLSGSGAGWLLMKRGQAGIASTPISALASVSGKLGAKDRLFFSLPLATGLAPDLKFGTTSEDMVAETNSLTDVPDYVLTGRVMDGKMKYAWIAPGAGKPSPSGPSDQRSLNGSPTLMPAETEWHDFDDPNLGATLIAEARKLSSLKNWSLLSSHDDGAFPYHVELVNLTNNQSVADTGEVVAYAKTDLSRPVTYQLRLVQNPGLKSVTPKARNVYVMDIGPNWAGSLVAYQNVLPQAGDVSIPLGSTANPHITFVAPTGTERFVIVTSETELPKEIFNFDGLLRDVGVRGGESPLERLLRQASMAMRDVGGDPPPTTWSIQRLVFSSRLGSGS